MKKRDLWICDMNVEIKIGKPNYLWVDKLPKNSFLTVKFPFTIDDLLLLRDFCENIPEDFPESIEGEKLADKLQKLIEELKK